MNGAAIGAIAGMGAIGGIGAMYGAAIAIGANSRAISRAIGAKRSASIASYVADLLLVDANRFTRHLVRTPCDLPHLFLVDPRCFSRHLLGLALDLSHAVPIDVVVEVPEWNRRYRSSARRRSVRCLRGTWRRCRGRHRFGGRGRRLLSHADNRSRSERNKGERDPFHRSSPNSQKCQRRPCAVAE